MLTRADAHSWRRSRRVKTSVAGRAIAVLLGALEALGVHGDHGYAPLGGDPAADRRHVVADEADDAGRVDEGGLGLVLLDQLNERA